MTDPAQSIRYDQIIQLSDDEPTARDRKSSSVSATFARGRAASGRTMARMSERMRRSMSSVKSVGLASNGGAEDPELEQ